MQVTILDAETNLSKLIDAALAGEEVIIAKGTKPVARLVPIAATAFRIGLLKGLVPPGGPDFLEPTSSELTADWEGR